MRKLNKALKMLLCATLVCSIGITATACNVDDDPGNVPPPEGSIPDGPIFVPPSQDASEGIDWTKYWDGVSNIAGSTTDNFRFDNTLDIGDITGSYVPDTGTVAAGEQCIVKFSDGIPSQSVESGGIAVKPITPQLDGKMFIEWRESGSTDAFDFSKPVTTNLNLVAEWKDLNSKIVSANGYNESLSVVWQDSNPSSASVRYRILNGMWTSVEKPLIRNVGGNARVDIVGLPAGEYEVEITTSAGGTPLTLPAPITVEEYDRSGYAHFNYTSGVGAYNDDGSLKSGALVIYVNEENKNDLTKFQSTFKNTSNGLVYEDISKYFWTDLNNVVQKGIGYLLNNRQYRNNTEREQKGIQALCLNYGAVDIRFLGNVESEEGVSATQVEGLTAYDSTDFGGTVGDNGHMARITNARNVTIEGIGDDATISGWGFHYVSNDNLHVHEGSGTSFEARNLTFQNYPEDALGAEGTQGKADSTGSITSGASDASSPLCSPVERIWIHNNTFLPGGCENAAESDKKEGDGSCDIKRGQYFTISYNYFTDCHKTNLVGSSKTSLTYNVTFHHNWWNNCQSRQPLIRRANVHYYNNYISGDMSASPQPSLSYVSSIRADCYMFAEANYYDGCKQVVVNGGEGGTPVAKAYNNVYYACFNTDDSTYVTSRTQSVQNNCQYIYGKVDYSNFDTNSTLFYYDAENQVSDCLLDDAVGARARTIMYAGAQGHGTTDTAMNKYSPSASVELGAIDLTKATKPSSTVGNVLFNGITGTGSTVKGKGQIATFTLSATTEVKVSTTTTGDSSPELFDSYGKVYAAKFNNSLTVVLPAGTYVIASGQKDKEANITSLVFADTGASSEERIKEAKAALAAIPSTITINSESVIEAAKMAYNALLNDEKTDEDIVALYPRYAKAVEAYTQLQVAYVIARIAYIGEVTASSYNRINAAQTAYSQLPADQQANITNYNILAAAWATYEGFAAQNVIDRILDLPDLTSSDVKVYKREALEKLQDWFNAIDDAYIALTSGDDAEASNQQATVRAHNGGATYKKLTDGLTELIQIEKLFDFNDLLENTNIVDAEKVGGTLLGLYNSLTQEQQTTITGEAKAKYNEIIEAYTAVASQKKTITFNNSTVTTDNKDFWTFKESWEKNTTATINGTNFSYGLNLDSNNSITFTTNEKMTLTVYYGRKQRVCIDGEQVTGNNNSGYYVATIVLEAGQHTITKGKDGTNSIFIVELSPVK